MNGDRVAAPAAPAAGKEIGRGLNTLLSAKEPPAAIDPAAAPAASAPPKALLPTWFFFAADLLLLAYAVAICFDAPKPMDLGAILFCAVSVGTGALLGIAGVLRNV